MAKIFNFSTFGKKQDKKRVISLSYNFFKTKLTEGSIYIIFILKLKSHFCTFLKNEIFYWSNFFFRTSPRCNDVLKVLLVVGFKFICTKLVDRYHRKIHRKLGCFINGDLWTFQALKKKRRKRVIEKY